MKKLLITGGTGTLGSHLVRLARNQGGWAEIHSTYHTLNPNYHRVYWHYADARNGLFDVLQKTQPTHILHTLAMTSPDECESRKLEAWEVNVKSTQEVAQFAENNGSRLIFTSTDLIFDGKAGGYTESANSAPVNFYGDTKVEAENTIRENMPSGNYVLIRLSLMYGFNYNGRKTFFDFMVDHVKNRRMLELYHDQIRSMISTPNAAEILMKLVTHDFTGVLHVGGPRSVSRFQFGKKLAERLGVPSECVVSTSMQHTTGRARRPAHVSLNTGLLQKILDVKLLDIDDGLRQVLSIPSSIQP
jgi:dTDP-4-dehydrorhamnose reductase